MLIIFLIYLQVFIYNSSRIEKDRMKIQYFIKYVLVIWVSSWKRMSYGLFVARAQLIELHCLTFYSITELAALLGGWDEMRWEDCLLITGHERHKWRHSRNVFSHSFFMEGLEEKCKSLIPIVWNLAYQYLGLEWIEVSFLKMHGL